MQKEEIIRLLDHIRNRQMKEGIEEAFRFRIYIKKQKEFKSSYPNKKSITVTDSIPMRKTTRPEKAKEAVGEPPDKTRRPKRKTAPAKKSKDTSTIKGAKKNVVKKTKRRR